MPHKNAELGMRLRESRKNVGLSQEAVAGKLDISRAAYIEIEKGERGTTDDQLTLLSTLFAVPAESLAPAPQETEEPWVALLRATRDADRAAIETEVARYRRVCRAGVELKGMLGLPRHSGPPDYGLPQPRNRSEAVAMGAMAAHQERHRLELGHNPISDMAELLTSQRLWASSAKLPDEISGLFLSESGIGMVVLVNTGHSRQRKRFSYAHEYAHALFDRSHQAKISTTDNRSDLIEVRANSFAAAFLMPPGGLRSFLLSRGKGLGSKHETVVSDSWEDDPDAHVRATQRTQPGSQKITFQDVAIFASTFGVSYEAAVYRVRSENYINATDMNDLLEQKHVANGFLELLDLGEVSDAPSRHNLRRQIVELGIEAFRRGLIDQSRLIDVSNELKLSGSELLQYARAAAS